MTSLLSGPGLDSQRCFGISGRCTDYSTALHCLKFGSAKTATSLSSPSGKGKSS